MPRLCAPPEMPCIHQYRLPPPQVSHATMEWSYWENLRSLRSSREPGGAKRKTLEVSRKYSVYVSGIFGHFWPQIHKMQVNVLNDYVYPLYNTCCKYKNHKSSREEVKLPLTHTVEGLGCVPNPDVEPIKHTLTHTNFLLLLSLVHILFYPYRPNPPPPLCA